ncbi:MAG: hypothetical protein H7323_10885 [Frankiales bacterium]|nr:hypothetical protein [Frankiales bacterium]
MSKVDALRAMREAKYARNGAPPAAGPAPTKAPARAPAARAKAEPADTAHAAETADTDELCGHRNMGGKSCSRPAGHSEKNHRYATA